MATRRPCWHIAAPGRTATRQTARGLPSSRPVGFISIISTGVVWLSGGEPRDEFAAAMKTFRENRGNPTIMNRIARGYTDAEIAQMAQHFARTD